MGIRLAVLDDNPHVRWQGHIYPVNATFHRFLSAFLDLDGSPVSSIAHLVPLQELPDDAPQPPTLPLDPRLRVVPTSPFDGIAGYLRDLPGISARNIRPLRRAIREADLLWLKVPASNAPLAALIAAGRTPRFGYVAGRALDVVRAQPRPWPERTAAMVVAAAYDLLATAASGSHRVVVGRDLFGEGVVTSLVEADEIEPPKARWPRQAGRLRLAWAGRLVAGKGLETVLDALALLPMNSELMILGDGPARERLMASANARGLIGRVDWRGYVADRRVYMDLLRQADIFVFPSPAEGFPKVVLDAMAAGLPIVASPAGAMSELASGRLIEPVAAGNAAALAAGVAELDSKPARVKELQLGGLTFAAAHTRGAEAARLVRFWRTAFPTLPWDVRRR